MKTWIFIAYIILLHNRKTLSNVEFFLKFVKTMETLNDFKILKNKVFVLKKNKWKNELRNCMENENVKNT